MKSTLIVLALTAAASAQPYSLLPSSSMEREACLPPCACPYTHTFGTVWGTFSLALLDTNPLYTRYRLNNIHWNADFSPGYATMTGSGTYTIGGEVAIAQRLELSLTIGSLTVITDFDSGLVPMDPSHPFPQISIGTFAEPVCRREQLRITATSSTCYGNCDGSTNPPILTANDFICYLNAYARKSLWAECDGSMGTPVLTPNDFQCFLNAYAVGCS